MIKLVIFDLDGTLVDAYEAIEKSINFTLKTLGYSQVGPSRVRRAVGRGNLNFIKTFIKDGELKEALDIYRKHHKSSLLKYSRLMPQVRKVLGTLKKRNYKLAIATNRPRKFSLILLSHLGLNKYFDLVACAHKTDEIKPNPNLLLKILKKLKINPDEAFYIGDMAIDVCAGNNAGIQTIAVLGGSSSRLELKKSKPVKIISSLTELTKLEQMRANLKT